MSADLLTRSVILDLPGFEPDYPLARMISTVSSGTGTLNLVGAPNNWERAIYEGGSLLACYDDADPAQALLWSGIVWTAGPFDSSKDEVPVNLSTPESALDNAYVGNVTYTTAQHRDDIIADLITAWFIPNTGIQVELDYTPGNGPTPKLMDNPPASIPNAAIIMQNTDNATVKQRIDQVCGLLGGQYTVDAKWGPSHESVVLVVRFGDRVGTAALPGLAPAVTFEMPGVLVGLQQMRDYSRGKGANKVVPYSTGQGDTSPFGTPVAAPADGRPTWEYRYQPAPSISPAALAQFATQAIKILAPGARPVTLTIATARAKGRRLGTDWQLGDDIGWRVPNEYTNEQGNTVKVLAFPNGLEGVGTTLGYQLTPTMISPVLADNTLYVDVS